MYWRKCIFVQFYIILQNIHSFIQPALNVFRNNWSPYISNNHKLLAKLHSGTLSLRIIYTRRLMSLFELLLKDVFEFVLISLSGKEHSESVTIVSYMVRIGQQARGVVNGQ